MADLHVQSPNPAAAATSGLPGTDLLLVAAIGTRRFAFPATSIDRVIQMVEFTPLPDASGRVAGALNVHGRTVPVVDARSLFKEEPVAPGPEQHLILMSSDTPFAVWVDRVERVVEAPLVDLQPIVANERAGQRMLRLDAELIPVVPVEDLSPFDAPSPEGAD